MLEELQVSSSGFPSFDFSSVMQSLPLLWWTLRLSSLGSSSWYRWRLIYWALKNLFIFSVPNNLTISLFWVNHCVAWNPISSSSSSNFIIPWLFRNDILFSDDTRKIQGLFELLGEHNRNWMTPILSNPRLWLFFGDAFFTNTMMNV